MSTGEAVWDIFAETAPIIALVLCSIALLMLSRKKPKERGREDDADE